MADERVEARLQESQERFLRLVDLTEDFIYSLDANSRFTSANKSFCRAMGVSESAIIGKTHEELGFSIQVEHEWREFIEQVLSTRENLRIEINSPMPDGFVHIYDVALTPLLDRAGAAVGVAGISRDITRAPRLERFEVFNGGVEQRVGLIHEASVVRWCPSASVILKPPS